jgi:methionyl-tRNA formyltransferase
LKNNNKIKLLYLGKKNKKIFNFLKKKKISFNFFEENVNKKKLTFISKYEYLISYNYRYILKKKILKYFKNKSYNCHISYLPWNKGAQPNFWSFFDNTPKGITIHAIDEGIDTGSIVFQKKITLNKKGTLKSTYLKLHKEMVKLIINKIPILLKDNNNLKLKKQIKKGTHHKKKEIDIYLKNIKNFYSLKVSSVEKLKNDKKN